MRSALAAAALLTAGTAFAQPVPGPLALASPHALIEDLAQRRAIRGATVDKHESPELRALLEFERDRFGPERERLLGPEGEGEGAAPLAGLSLPDLPVRWDSHVLRFLDFYRNERRGRSIMGAWLKRQGHYRELFEAALARHHLPRALLYVSMIESGYNPRDRSSAGAAGLWQFMPAGARIYGLRIDHWVDERNDPEKSTDAVAHYFEDLHARFGSWHLALAAFNAGYGAVLKSVSKYNTNDYWELSRFENGLPWETTLYVPKVIATAIVGENRALFGYGDVQPDPPWSFERVLVPPSTTLANVARAAGVTLEAVVALNPELRRDRTPPEPWRIRLPRGSGPRFLEHYQPSRDHVKPWVVKQGEGLETIARATRASTSELKRLNGIRDVAEVHAGVTLIVPERNAAEARTRDEAAEALIVPVPDRDLLVQGRRRVFYRVVPGDGLDEVAAFFGVSAEDVAGWNHLDPDARLVGHLVLQLWVAPDFDAAGSALDPAHVRLVTVGSDEFMDLAETRRGRRRLKVTAGAHDTLKSIGARYGLSEADMERINRLPRGTPLQSGQTLVVYVPVDRRSPSTPTETPLFDTDAAVIVAATGRSIAKKMKLDDTPAALVPLPPPADDPLFPRADEETAAPAPSARPASSPPAAPVETPPVEARSPRRRLPPPPPVDLDERSAAAASPLTRHTIRR